MTRQRAFTLVAFLTAFAIVALIMTGCGSDQGSAPEVPGRSGPPEQLGIDDAGSASMARRLPRTPDAIGVVLGEPDPTQTALVTQSVISGRTGGTMSLGRHTVVFPAGAFRGDKEITMEVPDLNSPEVHLYPDGVVFDVPVILQMDLGGLPEDGPDTTIYWYDPASDVWVDLCGTYDPETHTVTASLEHFCQFRGGRAGW